MSSSRTTYIIKNATWTYVGKVVSAVLGLINRTIIIKYLGVSYLGISGLYSNILGILSLTEFGLSYAINYCLYRPLAERDYGKVKAYFKYFKRLYQFVICIILLLGISISPFLKYIVKDPGSIKTKDLYIFFLIYLLNTAFSYISAHSNSLCFAQQKGYITTNIHTIGNIIVLFLQSCSLILFRNYYMYLLIHSTFTIAIGIYINWYITSKKSYLTDNKYNYQLNHEEKTSIKKQLGALLVSKVGEISVTSSDNIIISALNGLNAVGLVSNYIVVIDIISSFTSSIINAFVPSFGNVIAVESKARIKHLFQIYNFLTCWIYGVCTVCLFSLFPILISVWVGNEYSVSHGIVACLVINFYMYGVRMAPGHLTMAAGLFSPNKYVSFIQGAINLVTSIIFGKIYGVLGVFIGTIISGLVPSIMRPIILYKHVFQENPLEYFIEYIRYFSYTVIISICAGKIIQHYINTPSWISLILISICLFVMTNVLFVLVSFRRWEFIELKQRIKSRIIKN